MRTTLATEAFARSMNWRRRTFNVIDYGAVGDGVTDDTEAIQSAIDAAGAAYGGRVVFPTTGAAYLVAGPTKAGSNAQLVFPNFLYGVPVGEPPVTITLEGETPVAPLFSVVTRDAPPPVASTIKSTLAGAGSILGAYHIGSLNNFTRVLADVRNLAFEMPPNPVGVAIDLTRVAQAHIAGVICHTGQLSVHAVAEPTNQGSTALILPGHNNGAYSYVESFGAIGYYVAAEIAEHANITELTSYGCKVAILSKSAGHTCYIQRLNVHHQPYGVRVTGAKLRMDIANFNIEHAKPGLWRTDIYDVDDPGNLWVGQVRYGVGEQDPNFRKNGGTNVTTTNIGNL